MSKREEVMRKAAMVEARYGKTLGASKGKAPVSSKPKIKSSGTNPLKKKVGIKATWEF
jgi:hypothetical protein